MKTAKLTVRQQEAIGLVEQGRVQYGHEFPPNMARRGHTTYPVFLIDGHAATTSKAAPSPHSKNADSSSSATTSCRVNPSRRPPGRHAHSPGGKPRSPSPPTTPPSTRMAHRSRTRNVCRQCPRVSGPRPQAESETRKRCFSDGGRSRHTASRSPDARRQASWR